jgi:hypothetical protein
MRLICCDWAAPWIRKGRLQERTQSMQRGRPREAQSGHRRPGSSLRREAKPKGELSTIYLQNRGWRLVPENCCGELVSRSGALGLRRQRNAAFREEMPRLHDPNCVVLAKL